MCLTCSSNELNMLWYLHVTTGRNVQQWAENLKVPAAKEREALATLLAHAQYLIQYEGNAFGPNMK